MQIKFHKNLKLIVFLALCIATIAIIIRYSSIAPVNVTKKEHWQKMENEIDSWSDALGLGIDPGIKNTVIVLNLLGFKTEQSCEGHIDWGREYPWVSITAQDSQIDALNNARHEITTRLKAKESEIQQKHPDLSLGEALREEHSEELIALYQELHSIDDSIEKQTRLKMVPLKDLIAQFYKNRAVNPDIMLIPKLFAWDTFELHSLGGEWQIIRDQNEKQEKLKEYQQEMKLFTEFLTDFYFKQ